MTVRIMVGDQEITCKPGIGDIFLEPHILSPELSHDTAIQVLESYHGQPMNGDTLNAISNAVERLTGRKTKVKIHIDMEGDAC